MVNTEARYVVDGDYKTCLEKYRLTEAEAALVDRHTIGCKDRSPFRKTEDAASRYNIYVSRNIEQILRGKKDFPLVVGLFSSDGEMINIYGNPALIAEMEQEGIKAGSDWSFEHMGPNAVSIGLREQCALTSIGEENYHDVLQKYAIYFCSHRMSSAGDFTSLINLGGIAILVPKEHAHKNYEILGAAISNGIISTMHFNQMMHNQYFQSNKAVLFFDTMMMENQCTITWYNKNTEDLFKSTYQNLNFSNAELLIDPLPENSDFWAAVYDHIEVKNFQMTIKSNGQSMDCIVSVYPFNQPQLNAAGAIVVIDTPKKLSCRISKQVSNSAVITFDQIVGTSTAMENVKRRGRLLAQTDMNLLIMGESGVGKDVFAQAIHNFSKRSTQPFVAVNCGAIPRDLIASELFGYAGGAFTGAKKDGNMGKFEMANGGTLFLDEIGELPLDLQPILLRAVETKKFSRIGSNTVIDADVRIISATNENLEAMIAQKRFRLDLYYRLCTTSLRLPPLREREGDITLLAEHFARSASRKMNSIKSKRFEPEALELLERLPWNGNVRELQNLIEVITQIYPGDVITVENLLENINDFVMTKLDADIAKDMPDRNSQKALPYKSRKKLTVETIKDVLITCKGNKAAAAMQLGISRKTLYRHMARLGNENFAEL